MELANKISTPDFVHYARQKLVAVVEDVPKLVVEWKLLPENVL
jgi:hypothetical protein